ncbi:MAG: glutamate--tRNA ligase [Candidatus Helarchaeota archaeon]
MSKINDDLIEELVLRNAIDHKGKANLKPIINKIIGIDPEYKKKMKELIPKLKDKIEDINNLSLEKQKELYDSKYVREKPVEKKEKKLVDLLPKIKIDPTKTPTFIFPPEPSKYLHIGHAKAALINYYYSLKYNGKFYLRLEDSNPLKVSSEYYEIQKKDLEWLGVDVSNVDHISDHVEFFHERTIELLERNEAYACTCSRESIHEDRKLMRECPCRNNSVEKNLSLWSEMMKNAKEGSIVIRLKIDMAHKNANLRDPNIMRIIEHPHPRTGTKFRVWPTYDLATSLMDHLESVTHRIRSKEFEQKDELHNYIKRLFGYEIPIIISIGRFNLEGVEASGRKNREKVESGKYEGWDDPRLPTLASYRRRGYDPKAITEFVLKSGLSKSESTVSHSVIDEINKKYIEKKARRFFFIRNPKTIKIKNLTDEVELHLRESPYSNKTRKLKVKTGFLMEENDYKEKSEVRLKEFDNFLLENGQATRLQKKNLKVRIIHWLPIEDNINVTILKPEGEQLIKITGKGENNLLRLNVREVIQFERFAFCVFDKKISEDNLQFIYISK